MAGEDAELGGGTAAGHRPDVLTKLPVDHISGEGLNETASCGGEANLKGFWELRTQVSTKRKDPSGGSKFDRVSRNANFIKRNPNPGLGFENRKMKI